MPPSLVLFSVLTEAVIITRQPISVSEHEGGSIRLRCSAKGFPLPTYQWIKLDEGELDTGVDKELILENVTPEDSGRYVCRVANDVNAVNSDIVTVRIIPNGNSLLCFFPSMHLKSYYKIFKLFTYLNTLLQINSFQKFIL